MNQKRGLTDTISCLVMEIPWCQNNITENLEQKKKCIKQFMFSAIIISICLKIAKICKFYNRSFQGDTSMVVLIVSCFCIECFVLLPDVPFHIFS